MREDTVIIARDCVEAQLAAARRRIVELVETEQQDEALQLARNIRRMEGALTELREFVKNWPTI